MGRIAIAGAAYFALVFGLGFLLGSVRYVLVGYGLSRGVLVALELPVMLAFAWVAAGWAASRFTVPTHSSARIGMGLIMLALLWVAEWAVGAFLMGLPLAKQLQDMATIGGVVVRGAQVLTAFFPMLRARLLE